MLMVQRLTADKPVSELASDLGCSERTVRRRLAQARVEGVTEAIRDVFAQDMLPRSLAVLQEALDGDDIKLAVMVAMKVIDGLKVFAAPTAADTPLGKGDTFEAFRERLTIRRAASDDSDDPSAAAGSDAPSGLGVIDVIPIPPAPPEPADASPAPDPAPPRVGGDEDRVAPRG